MVETSDGDTRKQVQNDAVREGSGEEQAARALPKLGGQWNALSRHPFRVLFSGLHIQLGKSGGGLV